MELQLEELEATATSYARKGNYPDHDWIGWATETPEDLLYIDEVERHAFAFYSCLPWLQTWPLRIHRQIAPPCGILSSDMDFG